MTVAHPSTPASPSFPTERAPMDNEQLKRYSRHIMLPQMDYDGQQKLLDSRVFIVGAGGLGSPVAMYLAASGVGQHLVE